MRFAIGQRIAVGFLIAIALLLAIGVTSFVNLRDLTEQRRWVEHTIQVLQQRESLFSRIADSTSAARGFALTGAEDFSERFASVDASVERDFDMLSKLVVDNVAQTQRLARLKPILDRRREASHLIIELRRGNESSKEAKIGEAVTKGSKLMSEIRGLLEEIQTEERRLLAERSAHADSVESQTTNLLLYGTLVAFLLAGIASILTARSVRRPLVALVDGANKIGSGDYAARVDVLTNDELGDLAKVFNMMCAQVEQRQRTLALQDWLNSNLARFSRLFEEKRAVSAASLCQSILNELATAVGAQHSVIYIPRIRESGVVLELQASYAGDNPPKQLSAGQGLAGQCFIDRKTLVLRDVPKDYIKINSALGAATPASLVVLPALYNGQVKAVIELASFAPPDEIQLTFLHKLCESLGLVFNAIEAAARTEELLVESQALSERLQAGQRELNERNHELEAQSERLRKSELKLQEQQMELKQTNEELEQSNEELQQTNAEMEEKQLLLEEQKRIVDTANLEVTQARGALEEKVKQLALTSKYKSEFLANMSHELRTPLNSLLILSKVLADNAEATLTERQIQRAEAIHSSGSDLLELINDILDLSKIEAGSVDLDVDEMHMDDLARFVDGTFRHMVEGKGLRFSIDVHPQASTVMTTDVRRVQQILKNLLANACKFTESGAITLTVVPATGGWEAANADLDSSNGVLAFAVTDTGIGIPPDRQQIIFEAFQQADAGTARKYGGTGLGLSISRELTRLLGGALTLKSQEKAGSTFTLYLPLKIAATEAARPAVAPVRKRAEWHSAPIPSLHATRSPAHNPVNVSSTIAVAPGNDDRAAIQTGDLVLLIVEDDKQFSRILADFARDKGFKILLAQTAESGIELAQRYKPSAITLDLLLPDNDGWIVLDRIKHNPETQHIPVHVISVDEQRERSMKSGAVSYLQKPVTPESIERALEHTIDFVNRPLKNLLVVEDDANQRQGILETIGNGDVCATAVGTAAEALRAIEAQRFDCIVLDLGLPDMRGSDLIAEIQRRSGEHAPPIVVYTGKDLSRKEETELRRNSEAIILKDKRSPERLLAETALFLHRVQAKLPESKRRLIEMIRRDDPLLSNRKVLVVDDDVRNIFAITAALESHKMDVVHAENGQTGIDLLHERPDIDIVLMDIMMPEMDGYEAIRRIRADDQFKKMPIIAVTAKAMKGDRERCLQAGASDYITKPVDMDQLRSLLRVWLYR